MRKQTLNLDVLESKNTLIEKQISRLIIPISYEHVNKLKKEVSEYLNSILFKWNSKLNGILLNYTDLGLYKRRVCLVDDQTYFSLPIKMTSLIFFPKKGDYLIGKITELTIDKIKLSFYDIVKGVIYLDNSNPNSITYTSKSSNGTKNYICNYSLSTINISGNQRNISTLDNSDIKIKLEEGKFIKVLISNVVVASNNTVGLVCDIDIHNIN